MQVPADRFFEILIDLHGRFIIKGKHLKQWTLSSLIRTDIQRRAVPWARLILETGKVPADLNLKWEQKASTALMGLAGASIGSALVWPATLAVGIAALVAVLILNMRLYLFFYRRKGLLFAIACVPLHLLYFTYSAVSYLCVWIYFQYKRAISVLNCAHG